MGVISFNSIPLGINLPGQYIEFDNSRAVQGTPVMPNKILVLGLMAAGGSQAANVPVRVPAGSSAVPLFGRGAQITRMLAALKAVNQYTEVWACAQAENGAGVAAVGSINFTAPATAPGTFNFYIGGQLVQIGAAAAQAATSLATALAAAINALPDLGVTAAVDGVTLSKVNITFLHKGLNGNDVDLRVNYNDGDATPPGLTYTIVAMATGAANPSLTAAIAAMGDDWYNHIIGPYTDAASLTALETELDRRFGPMVMKEGHYYSAAAGSVGTLSTLGLSRNSPHPTVMGNDFSPVEPCIWASVLGGLCAYYSAIDPGRPLQNLSMAGLLAPARADRFIWSDRNNLVNDGISTFKVDEGGNLIMERVVTMYRTNSDGVPDPSYQSLEKLLTLFYLRFSLRTRIALRYPRHKLADDDTIFDAGQAIVRPKDLRAEVIALFSEWEAVGLVQDLDQFVNDILVERDSNNPDEANALIPPHVIDQFRVFAGQIQFII